MTIEVMRGFRVESNQAMNRVDICIDARTTIKGDLLPKIRILITAKEADAIAAALQQCACDIAPPWFSSDAPAAQSGSKISGEKT